VKLSTIVVTKNRPEWLEWWAWNLRKQTRPTDQLIVVDSSEAGRAVRPDDVRRETGVSDLEFIRLEPSALVGRSRQVGLEAIEHDVLLWHDDDDWHHPRHHELLGEAIESGHRMAMLCVNHRLILDEMLWFRARDSMTYPHIPFCAFHKDTAQAFRFPNKLIGEDSEWVMPLSRSLEEAEVMRWFKWEVPGIILIHSANTWHRTSKFENDIALEAEELPPLEEPPYGIHRDEWEETWGHLAKLRERLGLEG